MTIVVIIIPSINPREKSERTSRRKSLNKLRIKKHSSDTEPIIFVCFFIYLTSVFFTVIEFGYTACGTLEYRRADKCYVDCLIQT